MEHTLGLVYTNYIKALTSAVITPTLVAGLPGKESCLVGNVVFSLAISGNGNIGQFQRGLGS